MSEPAEWVVGNALSVAEVGITHVEVRAVPGLHMRAASALARLADPLACSVWLIHEGTCVEATSILGLCALGAPTGSVLLVVAQGGGALEAVAAVRALFHHGFEESH